MRCSSLTMNHDGRKKKNSSHRPGAGHKKAPASHQQQSAGQVERNMVPSRLYEVISTGNEWARGGQGNNASAASSPGGNTNGSSPQQQQVLMATTSSTTDAGGAPSSSHQQPPPQNPPPGPLTPSPSNTGSNERSASQQQQPPPPSAMSSVTTGSWLASLDYLTGSAVPEYTASDDGYDVENPPVAPISGGSDEGRRRNSIMKSAAENTFSSLAGIVSSFLYTSNSSNNLAGIGSRHGSSGNNPALAGAPYATPVNASAIHHECSCDDSTTRSGSKSKSASQMPRHLNSDDVAGLLFRNPYNSVRGRQHSLHAASSLSAVRSLLTVLPHNQQQPATIFESSNSRREEDQQPSSRREGSPSQQQAPWLSPTPATLDPYGSDEGMGGGLGDPTEVEGTDEYERPFNHPYHRHPFSPDRIHAQNLSASETASQVAEGTLRALRDLSLDEAVELQLALRFWTERWERPLLSWLEAGPPVWLSPTGYNHQFIGRKVAQIQAVLARRCAAIGELQQHLLRAGWQRGVAQWGVLGQGEQWAAVAGFDGSVLADENPSINLDGNVQFSDGDNNTDPPSRHGFPSKHDISFPSGSSSAPRARRRLPTRQDSNAAANVLVKKRCGGGIFVDDPAFLTEWSLEAIALVRRQLKRAARGAILIPYEENWVEDDYLVHDGDGGAEQGCDQGHLILEPGKESEDATMLPVWVSEVNSTTTTTGADLAASDGSADTETGASRLVVTDLPLMVDEVSELLYKMEDIILLQRKRRLDVLKPPSWSRRNWWMVAAAAPPLSYILIKMLYNGYGVRTVKFIGERVSTFLRERVTEPVLAIFNEIWKGRESFSDREARMEAIESLKKMIKSWLDDTFPDMPDVEKHRISEAMDVTLVEQQKVESMKTFFEINNVIRMSFIEMQYMKKELLNALSAIDEMMSANDMTTNVAAITPVAMLAYIQTVFFKFMYHSMLKLGKSREETYGSFRNVLTDIERLLVMRDDPPNLVSSGGYRGGHRSERGNQTPASSQPSVLEADDLGMLMLLIHELRSILWQDNRRFSAEQARSVLEDLAELAGERGAVSVRQQLQIIARMCRTYSFLQPTRAGQFRSPVL